MEKLIRKFMNLFFVSLLLVSTMSFVGLNNANAEVKKTATTSSTEIQDQSLENRTSQNRDIENKTNQSDKKSDTLSSSESSINKEGTATTTSYNKENTNQDKQNDEKTTESSSKENSTVDNDKVDTRNDKNSNLEKSQETNNDVKEKSTSFNFSNDINYANWILSGAGIRSVAVEGKCISNKPSINIKSFSCTVNNGFKFRDAMNAGIIKIKNPNLSTSRYGVMDSYRISNDGSTITFFPRKDETVTLEPDNFRGLCIQSAVSPISESYSAYFTIETDEGTFTTQSYTNLMGKDRGSIKVRYIDEDTSKELLPSIISSGMCTDTLDIFPKDIPGYILDPFKGTITNFPTHQLGKRAFEIEKGKYIQSYPWATDLMSVDLLYVKGGKVLVKYIDEQGKEIKRSDIFEGTLGSQQKIEASTITGYTVVGSNSKLVTYNQSTQTITFQYRKLNTGDLDIEVKTFDPITRKATINVINKTEETLEISTLNTFITAANGNSIRVPIKSAQVLALKPNLSLVTCNVKHVGSEILEISPKSKVLLDPKSNSGRCGFILELSEDYAAKLPTSSYEAHFVANSVEGSESNVVSLTNYFGEGKQETKPDFFVAVPQSFDFTNANTGADASVKIVDENGQPYNGSKSVEIKAKSENNFKLKDVTINKTIPYGITYNDKTLSNSDNTIGTLSKDNPTINGKAKLLDKDLSNNKFNYSDTITYEFNLQITCSSS